MTGELVDRLARAVLYEGYNLYPYRATSVKNQRRFNFGVLAPPDYGAAQHGTEASEMTTEVLLVAPPGEATVDVSVRFLHLLAREIGDATSDLRPDSALASVESLEVDGCLHSSWREAVEREVAAPALSIDGLVETWRDIAFRFDGRRERTAIRDVNGRLAGVIQYAQSAVGGSVAIAAERIGGSAVKLSIRIRNTTPCPGAELVEREAALMQSFVSTHTVLRATGGEFVSLLEPPAELAVAASTCRNIGAWPVLVGESGARSVMLSSPIILYDYLEISPESAGDLFDGTEIDEILTLRIMTLTEDEKRQMRSLDDATRRILERTESMPEAQLRKLHATLRGIGPEERSSS